MEVQISPSCTKVQGGSLRHAGRGNDAVLFLYFLFEQSIVYTDIPAESLQKNGMRGVCRRPGWRTRPEAWNVQISPSCTKVQGIFRMGTATPEGIFFLFGGRREELTKPKIKDYCPTRRCVAHL